MIRSEIARLLISEVSDPRLQHLVITDVELTKDLRLARIYYEGGTSSDQKEITRGLSRAVAFFRRRLGANLDLRYVPELEFLTDEHNQQLTRILSALEQVQKTEHSPGAENE